MENNNIFYFVLELFSFSHKRPISTFNVAYILVDFQNIIIEIQVYRQNKLAHGTVPNESPASPA